MAYWHLAIKTPLGKMILAVLQVSSHWCEDHIKKSLTEEDACKKHVMDFLKLALVS